MLMNMHMYMHMLSCMCGGQRWPRERLGGPTTYLTIGVHAGQRKNK